MRILFVTKLDRYARGVNTIHKLLAAGQRLGHEVALFGERSSDFPDITHTLDVERFDHAVFVIYQAADFPGLPYLAQLIDGIPKDRRAIIDCVGRYNETIRVDHDFNHLEKLDGHQGWEWVEGFQAISPRIFQPTLTPLREDVRPFLFHGFDPAAVSTPNRAPEDVASLWSAGVNGGKPYGIVYIGNNWQRWTQLRPFLEDVEAVLDHVGPVCLAGWDWEKRPDWAVELGIEGVDLDLSLLERLKVETHWAVPFNEVAEFLGKACFSPVLHRPLFNELGIVTNRTFETFCGDTIPLLMLREDLIEVVYGSEGLRLAPRDGVADHIRRVLTQPEEYWDAVLAVRRHLERHHSFEARFRQLVALLAG